MDTEFGDESPEWIAHQERLERKNAVLAVIGWVLLAVPIVLFLVFQPQGSR